MRWSHLLKWDPASKATPPLLTWLWLPRGSLTVKKVLQCRDDDCFACAATRKVGNCLQTPCQPRPSLRRFGSQQRRRPTPCLILLICGGKSCKIPFSWEKIPGRLNIHYPHRADVPFGKCVHLNTSGPSITRPILALRHVAGGAEGPGLCLLCAGMCRRVQACPSRWTWQGAALPGPHVRGAAPCDHPHLSLRGFGVETSKARLEQWSIMTPSLLPISRPW